MFNFTDRTIPNIRVFMRLRDGSEKEMSFSKRVRWTKEGHLKYTQKFTNFLNQALHITVTRHNGFDATEVVVSITNGFPNAGVTYFTNLGIVVDNSVYSLDGKHIIRPRGIIAKRFVVGPDAEKVKRYEHIPEGRHPEWLPDQASNAIDSYNSRTKDAHGPYKPFWNEFHALYDSHGGAGIAPFSNWVNCHAGHELRSLEMYGEVGRSPIACLKPKNGKPLFLDEPYWLGRTPENELKQFDDWPDNWCEYSQWLMGYQAHDHTHLWRMIRAAAQLAHYDPFARMFLQWVWHDCTLSLTPGKSDYLNNRYFWSLKNKIAMTEPHVGADWAGRGLYHVIRCFLVAEPYVSSRQAYRWREQFKRAIMHTITRQGVCYSEFPPEDIREKIGNVNASRGFQCQLLASVYEELGLDRALNALRKSFPENLPDWFETLNTNNKTEDSSYVPYVALYNDGIFGYDNFEEFDRAQVSRGVNGPSQDYDCTRIDWDLV